LWTTGTAIEHIISTLRHSDSIVTRDEAVETFLAEVDSATVYWMLDSVHRRGRIRDGRGDRISTDKVAARRTMGLEE